ncbi:MAG: SUMF1/EgtB/PvdO family nonheme iron enzyme [Kiloniellaceae bacterium]
MRISKVRRIALVCLICAFGAWSPHAAQSRPPEPQASPPSRTPPPQEGTERRVALVIGNADYGEQSLANPVNDARAMARALEALGFEVLLREDASRAAMEGALDSFARRLVGGGVGLFYYAGHGARMGGVGYLVPVDADLSSEESLRNHALAINRVLDAMSGAGSDGAKVVVLDACGNNPFAARGEGSPGGLGPVAAPPGFLIAHATAPGAIAEDGRGANGVYTGALLRALSVPGLRIEDVFERARVAVDALTAGRQTPWTVSSLSAEYRLTPPSARLRLAQRAARPFARTALAASQGRGIRSSRESQAAELAFWESIKDSTNPAEYEAYLKAFPNGTFAPLARARIKIYGDAEPIRREAPPQAPPQAVPKAAAPASPVIDKVTGTFIARSNSNVRERPSTASRNVGYLKGGNRVDVLGRVRDKNWYQVRTETGATGYVAGRLIEEVAQLPAPKVAKPAKQAPPSKRKGSVAAVTPPSRPAVESPAKPAVGLFPSPAGEAFRDCPECPEMVKLPPGSFRMGARTGDGSERPVHTVTIRRPFAIGRYEVTHAQWMACVAASGCSYTPKAAATPERTAIRNLSWDDAQEYVRWLSKKTGRAYRLPSEAEWEYAARAGTKTEYWWGDAVGKNKANCKNCGGPWSRKGPAYVGTYEPNPYGLHDMNGGVSEWTQDCWYRSHERAPTDGSAREIPGCQQRVLRGGSWRNDAGYLRSAARLFYDSGVRYLVNGFRVAASVK